MKKVILSFAFLAFIACCFLYGSYQDMELIRYINVDRNKAVNNLFIGITDTASPVSFGLVVLFLFLYFIHKNAGWFHKAWQLMLCLLITTIITQLMKYVIDRPRPFLVYSFIEKLTDGGGGSFPSGHTADVFTVLAFFILVDIPRHILLFTFLWALSVAYSRVYLGVHYVSDVCGAMVVGICCSFAGWYGINLMKIKYNI